MPSKRAQRLTIDSPRPRPLSFERAALPRWCASKMLACSCKDVAAAAGVSIPRIFWSTLLPNIAISVIYAVAAGTVLLTGLLRVFLGAKGAGWYGTNPLL